MARENDLVRLEIDKVQLRKIFDDVNPRDRIFVTNRYGPTSDGTRYFWITIHIEKGVVGDPVVPRTDFESQAVSDAQDEYWPDPDDDEE